MENLKAIAAIVVSAAGALVVALGTGNTENLGDLGLRHWLLAIAAVLGSGGIVWFCENGPAGPAIKAIVGFLSTGIASLVVALDDGLISQTEWLVAFSAAVAGSGIVYQLQNRAKAA